MELANTLENRRAAAGNLFDYFFGKGVADMRRMPASIIAEGPKRTVYRYKPAGAERVGWERSDAAPTLEGNPVLLVPPLAAPATCFDLRRGCSLAEHLIEEGRPTYLVDYGPIEFSDKELGLEHWIDEVVPSAVREVSEDCGGEDVHLVGWCLGGIISLLTTADGEASPAPPPPVATVAMVASPFDFSTNRLLNPIRQIGERTDGRILGTAFRALGGAPQKVVETGFKMTALPVYLKKPLTLARRHGDRDFLAHIEAVDALMGDMYAYPGRTMGQLYQRFFRVNELAGGKLTLRDRVVDLADVRVPVLNVAGESDILAPVEAAHHVGSLLPNAPEVRLQKAPGGHLGVLTGRKARSTTWAMIDAFLQEPVQFD